MDEIGLSSSEKVNIITQVVITVKIFISFFKFFYFSVACNYLICHYERYYKLNVEFHSIIGGKFICPGIATSNCSNSLL